MLSTRNSLKNKNIENTHYFNIEQIARVVILIENKTDPGK